MGCSPIVSSHQAPYWTILHARLQETLQKRSLLPPNASLLIAVSGGQDSLCLGQLLLDLRPRWKWELAIAHGDHRWSSDSGLADHVQQIASRWQLPFFLETAPPMPETEARAREWRYQALAEIAGERGFSCVVTGHTRSDRAETFLYNLTRGAGTAGLSALTWQRPLTTDIQLVRPLLNVSRPETLDFCQRRGLPIWHDRANGNLRYTRNRIRQEVLPYLQTHFNPQIEKHLAQTTEILEAESDYLEAIAQEIFEETIDLENRRIDRLKLRPVPLPLQRRIIRELLSLYLPSAPNFIEIEAVIALINAPNLSQTSSLSGGLSARVQGHWIGLADR
jgi:tRNA(Ile)-lysidine synthase